MALNFVCGYNIILEFKKSQYFSQNLGLVSTVEKNGTRVLNKKDGFAKFYNEMYRTIIYAQGNIGTIRFYNDYAIRDDNFAVYVGENYEEFINTFDRKLVSQKGVDFYIGHLIKMAEEAYDEKLKNDELKKVENNKPGDSSMVLNNPGNVSYADLRAYLEDRNRSRYIN
jgi:hypothetical protein